MLDRSPDEDIVSFPPMNPACHPIRQVNQVQGFQNKHRSVVMHLHSLELPDWVCVALVVYWSPLDNFCGEVKKFLQPFWDNSLGEANPTL